MTTDDSDSEDEDILDDDEPQMDTVMIQHNGAINRIRVCMMSLRCNFSKIQFYLLSLSLFLDGSS